MEKRATHVKKRKRLTKQGKIFFGLGFIFLFIATFFIWDIGNGGKEAVTIDQDETIDEVNEEVDSEVGGEDTPNVPEIENPTPKPNENPESLPTLPNEEEMEQNDEGIDSDEGEVGSGYDPNESMEEVVPDGTEDENEEQSINKPEQSGEYEPIEESGQTEENESVEEQDESSLATVPLEIGKVIYLTFDDGPHPIASIEILDLLKKYNAKATYFLLEPNIKKNPNVVKRMVEDGHSLGVHGVTHNKNIVYKSPSNFVKEMNQARKTIKELVNIDTLLVRAPYGSNPHITPAFKRAADEESLIIWDWNIDSVDWKYTNGDFVDHVIQQVNNLVGKEPLVVLLHEKVTTAAHLEKLLIYFKTHGYEMKAIDHSQKPVQFDHLRAMS